MEPGLDYFTDAGGAIDSLVRWDWRGFAANPPLMGPASLYLRAPFVWPVFAESEQVVYMAGALPCLAAVVALGFYLRRRMLALAKPEHAATLVAVLCLLNPGTFRSIHWGHPEELLAGALCVGAVLAGIRSRTVLAGLWLGLALATKQWAVIAILPTLLALDTGWRSRAGAAALAFAIVATLYAPMVIGNPGRFSDTQTTAANVSADAGGSATEVGVANVWWPTASKKSDEERRASVSGFAYKQPATVGRLTHPLAVLAGVPLAFVFWRRRRPVEAALGLLALAMLLRCVLDPWNNDYYHAPFLLGLLAWEGIARDGWPRLTLFASAALVVCFPPSARSMTELSADAAWVTIPYLIWALPLAGYLAVAVLFPEWLERRRAAWTRTTVQVK